MDGRVKPGQDEQCKGGLVHYVNPLSLRRGSIGEARRPLSPLQPRALREALTSGGFGRRHTAGATTAAAGHPLLPGIGGAALAGLRPRCGLAAPSFKTVSPGVLTVAINGDMPMTSVKDGKLIGTDGEMIAMIAQKPGSGPSLR